MVDLGSLSGRHKVGEPMCDAQSMRSLRSLVQDLHSSRTSMHRAVARFQKRGQPSGREA
jgi:hypothetical protein